MKMLRLICGCERERVDCAHSDRLCEYTPNSANGALHLKPGATPQESGSEKTTGLKARSIGTDFQSSAGCCRQFPGPMAQASNGAGPLALNSGLGQVSRRLVSKWMMRIPLAHARSYREMI